MEFIDCSRADVEFFQNNFCFVVAKELWYGKKYFEIFGEFI